jgi:hypothetical protein
VIQAVFLCSMLGLQEVCTFFMLSAQEGSILGSKLREEGGDWVRTRALGRRRRSLAWRRWHRPLFLRPFPWRVGRGAWWLWAGPFMLLGYGTVAYKLHRDDVQRIRAEASESASDLTEDELLAAMKRLGIRTLELEQRDREAIAQTE